MGKIENQGKGYILTDVNSGTLPHIEILKLADKIFYQPGRIDLILESNTVAEQEICRMRIRK